MPTYLKYKYYFELRSDQELNSDPDPFFLLLSLAGPDPRKNISDPHLCSNNHAPYLEMKYKYFSN